VALLIMEAIGPKGEELAMAAADATGIAVGLDPEFEAATFDADGIDDRELEATVTDALAVLDPDWRSHLRALD
jgi:hypothetical protein